MKSQSVSQGHSRHSKVCYPKYYRNKLPMGNHFMISNNGNYKINRKISDIIKRLPVAVILSIS